MLSEDQMIHPGGSGEDSGAALDAALAAADEDMLTAISNGLDLDTGLARILGDLGGSPAPRPDAQAQAHPGEDRSSRTHTRDADAASPCRVAVLIRDLNASDEAVENQYLRVRQAAGIAARSQRAAQQAAAVARAAKNAHVAIQAGHPHRRAPLPQQVSFALGTVALDGLACYFAAQVVGGRLDAALAWAGLLLAIVAGAEVALGSYGDRGERAWQARVILTGLLVMVLGVLPLRFLATTGTGLVPAFAAGACLLTAVMAAFLAVGYCALRVAETPAAWRARRQAHKARRAARTAGAEADRAALERDRLLDAYLGHVRQQALTTYPADRQLAVEAAARQHLLGKLPLEEEQAWRQPGSLDQG